jgi:NMD protein affecting ribosome stability and mRNA decay
MIMYGRRDRLIKEERHDVYKEKSKWPEPTLCSECGALFTSGRWSWEKVPLQVDIHQAICPACRRIIDQYPAGYIDITGTFFSEHREEILNLIYNTERREKEGHPLQRIMAINHGVDRTVVTTTGTHLARRLGEALVSAYKGNLSFHYAEAEDVIRVSWQR